MEKITFNYELNNEQKKEKEILVQALLKEPRIQDWLIKNHCQSDIIMNHSQKFKTWLHDLTICEKCTGLNQCQQVRTGKLLDLVYDGILMNEIHDCRYLKATEAQMLHEKNYKYHHCSEDMLKIAIDKIDFKNENQAYVQLVVGIMNHLTEKYNKKGFYLVGKPGVGKTYLGVGITNYYAKENKKVAFVNVPELISDLKMSMNDAYRFEKIMSDLKKTEIVVFDDIGGESVTSWVRDEILLPIFNERMEKKLLTYFTSNYTIAELETHFALDSRGNMDEIKANRLIERIKALTFEKNVSGINRRV